LAVELRACILLGGEFGLGLDLVTGAVFSAVNSPSVDITGDGPGVSFSGTAHITAPHDPSWNVLGEIAVAWRGLVTNAAAGGELIHKIPTGGGGASNTPFALEHTNPTGGRTSFVRSNTDYRVWQSNSTALTSNILASIVATQGADISVAPTFYLDAVPATATSQYIGAGSGAPTGNTDPLILGRRPDGALQHSGITHIALIAARTWDDGDGLLFHIDPYGVVEEAPRWYFVSESAAPTVIDLIAESVATGAPTVGTPALGQVHALAATGVATAAPTVGTPALGQTHALSAAGVATGAPTVGMPALGQAHALTAAGVATGAPTVGTPSLAQIHTLLAGGIATGAPSVGTPALGQVHALVAAGVATGAPTVGTPALNAAPITVPASRTVALPPRNRLASLAARDRSVTLPPRNRTAILPPERT
jgi:hypothetical protein